VGPHPFASDHDFYINVATTAILVHNCDLTLSQQRAVRSLQQQIAELQAKLEAYQADPDAYDNLGYLENAPSDEIRQQIIQGRIQHLQNEINDRPAVTCTLTAVLAASSAMTRS
jgi:hypothetical protein